MNKAEIAEMIAHVKHWLGHHRVTATETEAG
jgi:hypothetical protein